MSDSAVIGNEWTIEVYWKDLFTHVAIDASTTCTIKDPNDDVHTFTADTTPAVTRRFQGCYSLSFTPTIVGSYTARMASSGDFQGAIEGTFTATASGIGG